MSEATAHEQVYLENESIIAKEAKRRERESSGSMICTRFESLIKVFTIQYLIKSLLTIDELDTTFLSFSVV